MASPSDSRIIIPMLPPPAGEVGGHTPGTFVDRLDVSVAQGIFAQFQNVNPNRGGHGRFAKRTGWSEALARPTGITPDYTADPICNMVYQRGVLPRVTGSLVPRDFLFALFNHSDANHYFDAAVNTYNPSDRYSSARWDGWTKIFSRTDTNGKVANFWRAGAVKQIWSGVGNWFPSVRGFARLALGEYLDGPPSWFGWIDRKHDGLNWDGFFSDPNTVTEEAGRESYTNWWVFSAKPWTPIHASGGLTVYAPTPGSPLVVSANRTVWKSGTCYTGWYDYALCPMDLFGEIGPPVAKARYQLIDHAVGSDDLTYYYRGRTLAVLVNGMSDITTGQCNPNIRAWVLYRKYTPVNPNNEGGWWTKTVEDGGYGLATVPKQTDWRKIAILDSCGKQFEPASTGSYAARGAAKTAGFTESPQFNTFVSGISADGWIEVLSANDTLRLVQLPTDVMGNRPFWTGDTTNYPVYIEVRGYAGYYKVTNWTVDRIEGPPAYLANNVITLENVAGGSRPGGTYANITAVRFCVPWLDSALSNSYKTIFYDQGPTDEEGALEDYPFPDEADVDFETFYPHPRYMAESPDGRFVVCGFVIEPETGKKVYNRVYGNDGVHPSMFTQGLDIEGIVSGVAFLDETRFIVTTKEKCYVGEFTDAGDGQWIMGFLKEETPYGHCGFALHRDGEGNVFGLDSRVGLWVIGPEGAMIRQDLPPAGPQRLVWNNSQRQWFFNTFGDGSAATDANRLANASIVSVADQAVVALPLFTT